MLKIFRCALVFAGAVLWAMDDDLQVSNEEAIAVRARMVRDEKRDTHTLLLEKYIKQNRIFSKKIKEIEKEIKQNGENIENPGLSIATKEQAHWQAQCLFNQKLIEEVVACGPSAVKKFTRGLKKFVEGPQLRKEKKRIRKARKEDKVGKNVRSVR